MDCGICFRQMDASDAMEMVCGHYFHSTCLDRWIMVCVQNNTAPTCPFCRSTRLVPVIRIDVPSILRSRHDSPPSEQQQQEQPEQPEQPEQQEQHGQPEENSLEMGSERTSSSINSYDDNKSTTSHDSSSNENDSEESFQSVTETEEPDIEMSDVTSTTSTSCPSNSLQDDDNEGMVNTPQSDNPDNEGNSSQRPFTLFTFPF